MPRDLDSPVRSDDEFWQLVYDTLRRIAVQQMGAQAGRHSLRPTELVSEAWLRLRSADGPREWNDRAHFLRTAALAMRQVLVDHARGKRRQKRPPAELRVEFDDVFAAYERNAVDLLALDVALQELRAEDPLYDEFATLRFFGGASLREVGEALGTSDAETRATWAYVRAKLRKHLTAD